MFLMKIKDEDLPVRYRSIYNTVYDLRLFSIRLVVRNVLIPEFSPVGQRLERINREKGEPIEPTAEQDTIFDALNEGIPLPKHKDVVVRLITIEGEPYIYLSAAGKVKKQDSSASILGRVLHTMAKGRKKARPLMIELKTRTGDIETRTRKREFTERDESSGVYSEPEEITDDDDIDYEEEDIPEKRQIYPYKRVDRVRLIDPRCVAHILQIVEKYGLNPIAIDYETIGFLKEKVNQAGYMEDCSAQYVTISRVEALQILLPELISEEVVEKIWQEKIALDPGILKDAEKTKTGIQHEKSEIRTKLVVGLVRGSLSKIRNRFYQLLAANPDQSERLKYAYIRIILDRMVWSSDSGVLDSDDWVVASVYNAVERMKRDRSVTPDQYRKIMANLYAIRVRKELLKADPKRLSVDPSMTEYLKSIHQQSIQPTIQQQDKQSGSSSTIIRRRRPTA